MQGSGQTGEEEGGKVGNMAYSKAVYKVDWDPSNLIEVISKSGLSHRQVSDVTGVPLATLNMILSRRILPNASALLSFADYFGVSVDYLCGREPLPDGFGEDFMMLRRLDYAATFLHRRDLAPKDRYGEAPWPYNILDDVVCGSGWGRDKGPDDYWDAPVTPDQEAALTYLLSTMFPERTQKVLRLYYKEGGTLETVSKEVGLTRERVRQILAKAVRQLRHPSRFKMLVYGLDGYERFCAIRQKALELEREEKEVDDLEKELIRRRFYIESALEVTPDVRDTKERSKYPWDVGIADMGLSVRPHNCLVRAGCNTLSDVCELAKSGEMLKVRNMGRRSLAEVLSKVLELTGEDYREVYAD